MAEWSLTNHGMRLLGFYSISSQFRGPKVVKQGKYPAWQSGDGKCCSLTGQNPAHPWDQGLPCDLFARAWLCYSTPFLGFNREHGVHQVTSGHLFL